MIPESISMSSGVPNDRGIARVDFRRVRVPAFLALACGLGLVGGRLVVASAGAGPTPLDPAASGRPLPGMVRSGTGGREGDGEAREFPSGHALVIAIAKYDNVNGLPDTVLRDGQAVHDLLVDKDKCGYPAANVTLLKNGQATRKGILEALEKLAARTDADSTVVIYFSGHGGRMTIKGKERAFLVPVDFDLNRTEETWISREELGASLSKIKAGRLVVLLDACHSAGAGELPKAFPPGLAFKAGVGNATYEALAQGRGRALLAACREDESSWILPDATNSLFTTKLLEVLNGATAAPGDDTIKLLDVFRYVSVQVPKAMSEQHPVFSTPSLENDFAVALLNTRKQVVGDNAPPVEVVDQRVPLQPLSLPGRVKIALANRLVDRWNTLAVYLEVPLPDQATFPRGGEPMALLNWLELRDRESELRPAFTELKYQDLLKLLPTALPTPEANGKKGVEGRGAGGPSAARDDEIKQVTTRIIGQLNTIRFDDLPADVSRILRELLDGLQGETIASLLRENHSEAANELRYLLGDTHERLAQVEVFRYRYEDAVPSMRNAFNYWDAICQQNPKWQPSRLMPSQPFPNSTPPYPPVCLRLSENRLQLAGMLHIKLRARVDDDQRDEVRRLIEKAIEGHNRIPDDEVKKHSIVPEAFSVEFYMAVASAYYMNGDIDRAYESIRTAGQKLGAIGEPGFELSPKRILTSRFLFLRAGLECEKGKVEEAFRSVVQAKNFAGELKDARCFAGYVHLLIARAARKPNDVVRAIHAACSELSGDHVVVPCHYNYACALGEQAELSSGEKREEYVQKAATLLVSVLRQMNRFPLKMEPQAIVKDPFLKHVVEQEAVRQALDDYNWNPRAFDREPMPMYEFWDFGVPLEGMRFTRLNGDDRAP
jgi:hypothetical protein